MSNKLPLNLNRPLPGTQNNISSLLDIQKNVALKNDFLDIKKIEPNPENEAYYPQSDIEDIYVTLKLFKKLFNPIIVKENELGDKYIIVDGERRYRAIKMLSKEEYNQIFPYGINCTIWPADSSDFETKMLWHSANYTQRDNSDLRKKQILDMMALLDQGKRQSLIKDEVYNTFMDRLNLKKSSFYLYKNANNLIPELKEEFYHENISLNDASDIGSMDITLQKKLADNISEGAPIAQAVIDIKEENDILKHDKKLSAANDQLKVAIENQKNLEQIDADKLNKKEKERHQKRLDKATKKVVEAQSIVSSLTTQEPSAESLDELNKDIVSLYNKLNIFIKDNVSYINLENLMKNIKSYMDKNNL